MVDTELKSKHVSERETSKWKVETHVKGRHQSKS